MKKHNHSRPITIGDRGTKDDPWLDKEIQKIRDQRMARNKAAKSPTSRTNTPPRQP